MPPTTATALITRGGKLSKETIPVPTPGEHQVLVKISHVAQNPTDSEFVPPLLEYITKSPYSPITRRQRLWRRRGARM